jgi:hypothetical protein
MSSCFHYQRLIDFSLSECQKGVNIYVIKDRIVSKKFYKDTLSLTIGLKENCCLSPSPEITLVNDTLYLKLNLTNDMFCMCDCCFNLDLNIEVESEPKVVMLRKSELVNSKHFIEIFEDDDMYSDYEMRVLIETQDDSIEFKYKYHLRMEVKNQLPVIKDNIKSGVKITTDSSKTESSTIKGVVKDELGEPIPFTKIIIYDEVGNVMNASCQTDFNGCFEIRLKPGVYNVEVRNSSYSPMEFEIDNSTINVSNIKVVLNMPGDGFVYSISSSRYLSEGELLKLADCF